MDLAVVDHGSDEPGEAGGPATVGRRSVEVELTVL